MNCTFKLRVKKKFDHEKTIAPPHVSNGAPLTTIVTFCGLAHLYEKTDTGRSDF